MAGRRERSVRLLVVNWQDRENPQAGGAELHLHEIFGRLARRGHEVTLLCSGWTGAPARAEIDGMEVHRVGGRHSFTLRAAPYYRRELAHREHDFVIEDLNKLPLYSPLWARTRVVMVVHHLFGATAFREATAPFATIVWLAEALIPYFYSGVPVQVVSESTAEDRAERGLDRSDIRVIYNGVDHSLYTADPAAGRFDRPTFAYVGRLKQYKRLELAVDAIRRLHRQGIDARLIIAGKGDYEAQLRRYAEARAPDLVEFRGFVADQEKVDLLRKAWATVYPSPKEGWGLTNIEAAACGTPTVASDSPGLRESVAHGQSGLLVPHGDVSALAAAMRRIVEDDRLRSQLRDGALGFAADFSWDRSADATEAHLAEILAVGPRAGDSHHRTSASEAG